MEEHLEIEQTQTLSLPGFFGDGMVLQRGQPIHVWGRALAGQRVTVQLASQKAAVTSDLSGAFSIRLLPLDAGGPHVLKVTCGSESVQLKDVLIGEVWVCAGQSNMRRSVRDSDDSMNVIAGAMDSRLRLCYVEPTVAIEPASDLQGRWSVAHGRAVAEFSAVGYHFGALLREQLDVPVGVIDVSAGGSPIRSWMSRQSLTGDPELERVLVPLAELLDRYPEARNDLTPFVELFRDARQQWNDHVWPEYESRLRWAKDMGQPLPTPPVEPEESPADPFNPTVLHNANIAPLSQMPVAGVAWYQGEHDARMGRGLLYRKMFRALIAEWRRVWAREDLAVVWVQLASYQDKQLGLRAGDCWASLREAQTLALAEPRTAMAIAFDNADITDLHPRNKHELGRRLALATLSSIYSRDIASSGPVFDSMRPLGNKARLLFHHVRGGLAVRGTELRGFFVAAHDGPFHPATATIEAGTVVVSSPKVAEPTEVRYGWGDAPGCNLYNVEGLPAAPFRTDQRPLNLTKG
jgi:sialate O-acetylesterase